MELTRRDALTAVGLTAVSATLAGAAREAAAQQMAGALPIRKPTKNRITQSVCQWCYRQMALKDFFKGVADRGLTHVDLLNEEQWTVAKNDFGLKCSMAYVGAGGDQRGPEQSQAPRDADHRVQDRPAQAEGGRLPERSSASSASAMACRTTTASRTRSPA